ncbi:PX domain-containing protein ypt35 [Agyrium rufum]|nr:PX domain-containing protein ypt35 [Agyrium rufum]
MESTRPPISPDGGLTLASTDPAGPTATTSKVEIAEIGGQGVLAPADTNAPGVAADPPTPPRVLSYPETPPPSPPLSKPALPSSVSKTEENPPPSALDLSTAPVPAAKPQTLESIVPPYWQHQRGHSRNSVISIGRKPSGISLEDHEDDEYTNGGQSSPLWAKIVNIDEHVVVSGNMKRIGDYVVWICKVATLEGGNIVLRKRYSEFEVLREKLEYSFPKAQAAMPKLPPKSLFRNFRPEFLEKRRAGLEYFLNCILLNPEFSGSPILKDFIFE